MVQWLHKIRWSHDQKSKYNINKSCKGKKRVEEQISLSLNTEIRVICACTNKTRKLSQNKLTNLNEWFCYIDRELLIIFILKEVLHLKEEIFLPIMKTVTLFCKSLCNNRIYSVIFPQQLISFSPGYYFFNHSYHNIFVSAYMHLWRKSFKHLLS